ncbi:hypothetical protein [Desulfonema magnum]|uniref:DUF1351 domain-containing protein n=1 Tax=Desulfonema magnum TaxID=45655 RepID=A0A975BTW0_9BACT|nr:hypothetical protein [Desulfonema magnum]QTA91427.1 Uncharacterized protein dnm_074940 [Desulfonema magnum]
MNQLVIKLKGEIQSSNFDEWKHDLITQIQSINTKLTTDDDFMSAIEHVKLFKTAEKFLKDAKQSAINQAADIQKLFTAIDEISEEARQARLSLDRQIRARKQEIKEKCIQSGIEAVRAFIDLKSDDFQLTDHSVYLDRGRFETAVKGKSAIKRIKSTISSLCDTIKSEISQKAAEVTNNGAKLDALPDRYKLLFQDRNSLLTLSSQELHLTIEKRIALFNEENAKIKAEKAISDLKKFENSVLNPDIALHSENPEIPEKQKYRIIIDILSTKDAAIETARSVRQDYGNNASISGIRLTRVHDYIN